MYLGIPTQKSCARAWVAAASAVIARGDESYNVVIDVEDPWNHDDNDNAVITLVDKFLKAHDENPIITVANTIFPQALYEAHGSPEFYDVYHRDFRKFSRQTKNWGEYFDRLARWEIAGGQTVFPLKDLIAKLRRNEAKKRRVKAVYELAVTGPSLGSTVLPGDEEDGPVPDLTIYAPGSDRNRPVSGPCLSYLSFKRHVDGDLLLTAVYRNHYYMAKLLGNLIGLGWLQAFVAKEAGLKLGSLTVISTHAVIDTAGTWRITEARELVGQAAKMLKD